MSIRIDKINSLIKEELSLLILHKVEDPSLGLVTVTSVKTSPDISQSKVYVSIFPKENRQAALDKLEDLKKLLRSELAQKVRLRHVPELIFFLDDTLDYVEKMENLFKDIHKNDNQENQAE